MQFAHNGYYKGSTPLGLNLKQFQFIFYNKNFIIIKILKGIWSSLVYGVRLENEYFYKVVSSNLTVPVLYYLFYNLFVVNRYFFFTLKNI